MLIITATLLLAALTLARSLAKGNLVLIVFQAAMLVLVYGQALWLLWEFQNTGFNTLNVGFNAVRQADLAVVVWFFLGFQLVLSAIVEPSLPGVSATAGLRSAASFEPSFDISTFRESTLLLLLGILAPALMLLNAGGTAMFKNPGSMLAGQTLLLFLLGVLKWPLLIRIATFNAIAFLPALGFITYLFFALFTSRFMTLFALIQLILAIHYFRKPLNITNLFLIGLAAVVIVLGFGVFRDIASNNIGSELSISFIIEEGIKFIPLILDWFYTLNAEVVVGICNAIFSLDNGSEYDLLVSEWMILVSWFPNSLKIDPNFYVHDLLIFIENNKFNSRSVVPSGFELYYAGAGYFGLFFYSVSLLFFLWFCEKSLSSSFNPVAIVLAVQAVNGIRGSLLAVLFFFGAADYLAYKAVRIWMKKIH